MNINDIDTKNVSEMGITEIQKVKEQISSTNFRLNEAYQMIVDLVDFYSKRIKFILAWNIIITVWVIALVWRLF